MLKIYRDLNFPLIRKYYLLEDDRNTCPEILEKFQKFLSFYQEGAFMGYIKVTDKNQNIDADASIVIITNHSRYESCPWIKQCVFFVLWDDKQWGKLEWFNKVVNNKLPYKDFSINIFREMVGIILGKSKHEHRELFGYFLKRLLPHKQNALHHIPMLFKKEANYHEGYFYGHPMGYARDLIRYDLKFKKEFQEVMSYLSDEKSKEAFKLVLYGTPDKIWQYYFNHLRSAPQYMDYVTIDKDSVILNCGVESGNEIPMFLSFGSKKIYNIDPFGASNLSEYVREWCRDCRDQLVFIENWLYDKPVMEVSDEKEPKQEVAVTSLKEIISLHKMPKIDFVKTDIEGAEREMVGDLVEIIAQYRPQLAISIYHTQHHDKYKSPLADLVEIPLKIMKEVQDYNFYINFYSFERWEIILYCIPKEKIKTSS